ncbi:MAG TPA: 3-dehydroquinate synthase, partial [bacterium]|nr:3-dehydroquinate synthase [bacterium]
LEAYFKYKVLTHGEAVGYGMLFAAMLSQRLGLCGPEVVSRQHRLLLRIGLLANLPRINREKVYEKMLLDKKVRDNRVQFILTRKIGLVTIQKNIPKNTVLSTLKNLQRKVASHP